MAEAELLVRWVGGQLDLGPDGGVNFYEPGDGTFAEYTIDTLADGTEWGNPETVRRTLRRFLLDGSASVKEYDDNRTIPLSLRVSADDGLSLAMGEIPLSQLDGRRCELVWQPEDVFSPKAVFVVVAATLRHVMKDTREAHLEHFYTLTLECLPHAFSDEYVTVPGLAQAVSTPATVDNCSSATGWSASGATLSVVSGQIVATVPAGVTDWSVTRTGAVDFTPDRYLRVTGTGFNPLTSVVAATAGGPVVAPRVGADGGAGIYDVGVDATALTFNFHRDYAEYDNTVSFDLLQKQSTPRSAASRQQVATIAVPGSRRTSGSLLIESPGAGLGDVIVYTGLDYDPTMSPWTVPGTNRRVADSSMLSGAADALVSGYETARYRRRVSTLPRGTYAVWVRASASHDGDLTIAANLRDATGATVIASLELGVVALAGDNVMRLLAVCTESLPFWETISGSDLIFEITATWGGSTAPPGGGVVDEILLAEIGSGSLSIVRADTATRVWLDAPTLDRDVEAVLAGTSPNKSSAYPMSLMSQILAWGGAHALVPAVTNVYLGATGVAGATIEATLRPAWHTHPSR